MECGSGFIFDGVDGCVPGNRDTCQRDEVVPKPTFPTDVPPPNVEQICEGVNLGLFANPSSCTSYVLCIFGSGEVVDCQSNVPVFDAITGACVAGNKSKFI